MIRLYEWDEFEEENEVDEPVMSDREFTDLFADLTRYDALKKYEPIEFLKSLNLTKKQYKKLAEIFLDIYGYERWSDGNSDGYQQGYDSASDSETNIY